MHTHTIKKWQHNHNFIFINKKGEIRTIQVLILTVVTMVVEIIAGSIFGSMALLADGWHMGTHAAAFAITIFAYRYTRKHAEDKQFTFGTGKVSILGGFSSAVALAIVAIAMTVESVERIITPHTIHFNEAIIVAVIGLTVNLFSAFLLQGLHETEHEHAHHHGHNHHHDHNLRGAYFHVLADALTSVLAIIALILAKNFGWNWLDPVIGIVGAILITRWAYGLMKDTSSILLDKNIDEKKIINIKKAIEADSDNRVSDIHIWKVGQMDYAAIIAIVTEHPDNPEHYKNLLNKFKELSHITIEINQCKDGECIDKTMITE